MNDLNLETLEWLFERADGQFDTMKERLNKSLRDFRRNPSPKTKAVADIDMGTYEAAFNRRGEALCDLSAAQSNLRYKAE